MRVVVRADDGDEIALAADDLATEQSVLRLEFQNTAFGELDDYESVTLTVDKARKLADALLRMSDAIECFHGGQQPEPGLAARMLESSSRSPGLRW